MIKVEKRPDAQMLRPYQNSLVSEMKNLGFQNSEVRGYLSIPPGGGKTLTAIEFIVDHYLKKDKRVLWMAWDWILLEQAYETLTKQYQLNSDLLAYAAGSRPSGIEFTGKLVNLVNYFAKPKVLFTTPRIWKNQIGGLSRSFRPDLIVIDEAHYGIGGTTDREVKKYYERNKISVLGLSGTPKKRHEWDLIEPQVSFRKLVVDRYLSEPILSSIKTGLKYNGDLISDRSNQSSNGHLISQETIRELCGDYRRNIKIVEYLKQNSRRLGKTIVFAGNKEHADTLGAMLSSYGAIVIHEDADDPKDLIHGFKRNHYKIAVCVHMLKQGIDIPDVNSIIITVPTTSDIAYFQMACRGARITPGKSTFNLIDVEDTFNNLNFQKLLVKPSIFFSGGGPNRDIDITNTTLLSKTFGKSSKMNNKTEGSHSYEPAGQTFTFNYANTAPVQFQRLNGVRVVSTQTFGVECEVTHKDRNFDFEKRSNWAPVAERLLSSIRSTVGKAHCEEAPLFTENQRGSIDYSKWNVVFDGSCGWEIVSPILKGKDGIEDLVSLFHTLERDDVFNLLDLEVDHSTGMHAHFGWKYQNIDQTKRLIHAIRRFSPAFYSLVASSRLGNEYCRPIKNYLSLSQITQINNMSDFKCLWEDHDSRYHDVNFQGVRKRDQTFEVRLHSGSYDGFKMALWIALWMNLTHAIDRPGIPLDIESNKTGKGIDFDATVDADIIQICILHLGLDSSANFGFLEKLHMRRQEIFGNEFWRKKLGNQKINQLFKYWSSEFERIQHGSNRIST